jgi:hypothetical protein
MGIGIGEAVGELVKVSLAETHRVRRQTMRWTTKASCSATAVGQDLRAAVHRTPATSNRSLIPTGMPV